MGETVYHTACGWRAIVIDLDYAGLLAHQDECPISLLIESEIKGKDPFDDDKPIGVFLEKHQIDIIEGISGIIERLTKRKTIKP